MRDRRGVSSVLGVVMILGITVMMVTSLMVIGVVALQASQSDSKLAQMENSMSQLSSQASLVALGQSSSYQFDLGDVGTDSVRVDEDAGSMLIEMNVSEEEDIIIYETDQLGALVFEHGDHEIAYQAGGVWARTGDDGGTMLSPPEFHYRDATLTLPIIVISGDDSTSGQVTGGFAQGDTTTEFPNVTEDLVNPVDNATVKISIQSEYHRGWYEYLEERSEGEINHEPDNQTVEMELTMPFEDGFSSAIAVRDRYDPTGEGGGPPDDTPGEGPNGVNESEIEEGVYYPSASQAIEDEINDCLDNVCDEFDESNDTFEGGTVYFTNESLELSDVEFVTDDGDIRVVIDGKLEGLGDVSVSGEHNVSIYTRDIGDMPGGGDSVNNAEGNDAVQFRLYVHSNVGDWDLGSGEDDPAFKGIIYAPSTDITIRGNFDFKGAIVANEITDKGSPATGIEFDPALEREDLEFEAEVDAIQYLHVTEIEIAIDFD